MIQPVLEIEDLYLSFPDCKADVHALNHVSLHINRGEIVDVVGESGSGRSVTAMLTMRLLPEGGYRIHQGHVSLLGEDVLNASEKRMRQWRGARIAMIFQEPMTALNPTRRIGQQMVEVIRHHRALSRTDARQKVVALPKEIQIPDAPEVMKRFPSELPGGMCQRVMTVLVLSCEPKLIIADELIITLDVTVQLQVLRLSKLKVRAGEAAVLLISHDMVVVSQLCDRLYVMYAGSVIENGPTQTAIRRPMRPYSVSLLECAPERDEPYALPSAIPGTVPSLTCSSVGCASRERCFAAGPRCEEMPALSSQKDTDQQSAY